MKKRILSIILICAIITVSSTTAYAYPTQPVRNIEEILSSYHANALIAQTSSNSDIATASAQGALTLEQEAVNELVASGYEAYNVTASNYNNMEAVLQTDLSSMGIVPEGSFVVVVSGDDAATSNNPSQGASTYATAGSSFTYDYDGKTYTLRYLTVTAADYSNYGKASYYNLQQDAAGITFGTLLENFLNTSISMALDYISGQLYLGTISSLCGLQLVNFADESTAFNSLQFHAGSNWTRIFTQVWSEATNAWVTQLHVEYVTSTSYITGLYYSAAVNSYVPIDYNPVQKVAYSNHLDDRTWRIENAILGFKNQVVYYDFTGKVEYMYKGKVIITHYEDF